MLTWLSGFLFDILGIEVIAYEEQRGIYREPREKSEN